MKPRLAVTILAFGLLGTSARADVLEVGTFPYFTIQQAVDAAQDGDVLLVASFASQPSFTVDGKGLTIIGDGPVSSGTIIIRNIAAGQRVLVQNLHAQGVAYDPAPLPYPTEASGLIMSNTAGPVRFADCTFAGADSIATLVGLGGAVDGYRHGAHGAWLSASNADVAFVRCTFQGGDGAYLGGTSLEGCGCTTGGDAGRGLLSVNSLVVLSDCVLAGGLGGTADAAGGLGGDAYRGIGGTLVSSGSSFSGGDGGDAFDFISAHGGNGGAGVSASSTTSSWLRDDETAGGEGGFGFNFFGVDGQAVTAAGPLTTFEVAAGSLDVTSPVREGELADITIAGQAGDLVFVLGSLQDGALLVPHFSGWLSVGAPFAVLQFLGALPAGGELAGATGIPELGPGFDSLSLRLQCLLSSDGIEAALSSWTPLVIVDDGF